MEPVDDWQAAIAEAGELTGPAAAAVVDEHGDRGKRAIEAVGEGRVKLPRFHRRRRPRRRVRYRGRRVYLRRRDLQPRRRGPLGAVLACDRGRRGGRGRRGRSPRYVVLGGQGSSRSALGLDRLIDLPTVHPNEAPIRRIHRPPSRKRFNGGRSLLRYGGLSTRRRLPQLRRTNRGNGVPTLRQQGRRGWCNHYDMPIYELKQQPVQPGEEIVVEVDDDIHESGAGVGRTDDGFIVLVDGLLPGACRGPDPPREIEPRDRARCRRAPPRRSGGRRGRRRRRG